MRWPDLGEDRDLSVEPRLCSLCDGEIPEGLVSLMLFGPDQPDGGCLAWVYCVECELLILTAVGQDKRLEQRDSG